MKFLHTSLLSLITLLLFFATPTPTFSQNDTQSQPDVLPQFSTSTDTLAPATGLNPQITSIGDILSLILPLTLVLAGITFLVLLIMGGFDMLTNPTNPDAQAAGQQRITWAFIGFFILFLSYWIMQIIEILFNINIV